MRTLILLVCVGYALAETECNDLRRLKVKHQWAQAYGENAIEREDFGREIFDYFFDHQPKAIALFERVRGDNIFSPEFDAHMVRLISGLDMCISLLNEKDVLEAELSHLNGQHQTRGIPKEYFTVFESALWHAIPRHAPHFDQDAWHACYKVIANGITGTS